MAAAVVVAAAGADAVSAQGSATAPARIPNLAGKIQTVTGPIDPSRLGPTLMHEHIFIDFQRPVPVVPRFANAEDAELYEQPLTMETLSRTRYGRGVKGSNFLGDFDESYHEVMEFKKAGGGAIVDVSEIGLGRDPKALRQMANATGLDIVMGASWYTKSYHPLDMDQRSVDDLAAVIVRDITVGVDGTGIRSGVIGEIGIDGGPLTPNEMKVIRASARAARITGAPMSFHAGGVDDERLTSIDISLSEGVDPSQIIMGHSGGITPNFSLVKRILEKGVYLQIDWLGVITGPAGVLGNRSDRTIASVIVELVRLGYADRILLSHDICTKPQLKTYGGTGFAYISEYFLPELRRQGLSEEVINKFMVDNPRRALTFVAPRPEIAASPASARRS
ncbi:MAG: aryldialkylphosphatase [Gemmatimonadaceae bacterium]|nr:aryldialkylphosphatase [Gemmatimonadaceae bacterium]